MAFLARAMSTVIDGAAGQLNKRNAPFPLYASRRRGAPRLAYATRGSSARTGAGLARSGNHVRHIRTPGPVALPKCAPDPND